MKDGIVMEMVDVIRCSMNATVSMVLSLDPITPEKTAPSSSLLLLLHAHPSVMGARTA